MQRNFMVTSGNLPPCQNRNPRKKKEKQRAFHNHFKDTMAQLQWTMARKKQRAEDQLHRITLRMMIIKVIVIHSLSLWTGNKRIQGHYVEVKLITKSKTVQPTRY